MIFIVCAVLGYLLGSLSFSVFLSRFLFGRDVRTVGSGNAGATNMSRVYGPLAGAATLLFDVFKAAVSVTAGRLLCGDSGILAAGCGCIIGHCFPVFHGFKGGKGVASGLALAFAADWRCGAAAVLVFLVVALTGRRISLASLAGSAAAPAAALLAGAPSVRTVMLAVAVGIIFCRHKDNIRRLINGTEPVFQCACIPKAYKTNNK